MANCKSISQLINKILELYKIQNAESGIDINRIDHIAKAI